MLSFDYYFSSSPLNKIFDDCDNLIRPRKTSKTTLDLLCWIALPWAFNFKIASDLTYWSFDLEFSMSIWLTNAEGLVLRRFFLAISNNSLSRLTLLSNSFLTFYSTLVASTFSNKTSFLTYSHNLSVSFRLLQRKNINILVRPFFVDFGNSSSLPPNICPQVDFPLLKESSYWGIMFWVFTPVSSTFWAFNDLNVLWILRNILIRIGN